MRWLIPVFLLACGHAANDPDMRSQGVSSIGGGGDHVARPTIEPMAPTSTSADPTDHKASAAALYDGRNYVAPAELAYSKTKKLVVYPACGGGEGPGEHCSLGGFDTGGATINIEAPYQVAWHSYPGKNGGATDRDTTIAKLTATFDALETTRMDRRRWTGATPLVLPDYGTLSWDPKTKRLTATRDAATTTMNVQWGDQGGPVHVFWAPGVPLAVVQLSVNTATGDRETARPSMQTEASHTEGYVVFIQLVVVPRP